MNNPIPDIIYSAIIGDAAGYTLNGMKKNHIHAVFRDISGYTDPEPGLNDSMHKWKKPGLYSSISQNTLITAACTDKKGFNTDRYIDSINKSPEVPGSESGIFRDPGEPEKNLFYLIKNGIEISHQFNLPCSRLLTPVLPFLLIKNGNEHFITAVKYISLFTKSSSTITCSIFLLQLIEDLISGSNQKILKTAVDSAEKVKNEITGNQQRIFESGHNPDYIISDSDYLLNLFHELNTSNDPSIAEKIICRHAEGRGKGHITRGSVNLPETILPMAVILSDSCSEPENIFFTAAMQGGAASSLTSVSAAITTANYGMHIPENLSDNLVNKKKIHSIIDLVADERKRSSIIDEIYAAEPGLTLKELDEFRAKNKNITPGREKKKNKTRKETESDLSRHIVESWTKLDKAKWKKERKKGNS